MKNKGYNVSLIGIWIGWFLGGVIVFLFNELDLRSLFDRSYDAAFLLFCVYVTENYAPNTETNDRR